jgi:hypothetical protein
MTGFQLAGPQTGAWVQPVSAAVQPGRHASASRARLTLRRLFYFARHAAR